MLLKVKIRCNSTNRKIGATICKLSNNHIREHEFFWQPRLVNSVDAKWDWKGQFEQYSKGNYNYRLYALESGSFPVTQGKMLIDIDLHRSFIEPGKNLVYVQQLCTAPWNRKGIVEKKMYTGVGTNLLAYAVSISDDLEFGGRIGLNSVPDAVSFYKNFGMEAAGNDSSSSKLKYLELSKTKAKEILYRFREKLG